MQPHPATHPHLQDAPLIVRRTLKPGAPGTIKLLRQHGAALVCVRYRENAARTERLTTVELIIDTRPGSACMVTTELPWNDRSMRQRAQQLNAKWDPRRRTWVMSWAVAKQLKIQHLAKPMPAGRPHRR